VDAAANDPAAIAAALANLLDEAAERRPLREFLAHLTHAAIAVLDAENSAVGEWDDAGILRIPAWHSADPGLGDDWCRHSHALGRCVLTADGAINGRAGDLALGADPPFAGQHMAAAPARWEGRLLGFVAIGMPAGSEPDSLTIERLALLARIAAVAIEHHRRRREVDRRTRRFELIARIASVVQHDLDLHVTLQRAADAIHEILGFPNVDIPLIDPANPGILVVHTRGGSYKDAIHFDDRLPIASGIMGAAASERRVQLVNDAQADPRYVCPPGVEPAQAELAVPIVFGDTVLGVLNVESDTPFDDLDPVSLEIVADYLAVTINNARLFQRSREAAVLAERQRLARDLHDSVTQILSSMSLLAQTLPGAWRRDAADGERRAARLHQLAQSAFAEMRMLLRQLLPAPADTAPVMPLHGAAACLDQLHLHGFPGAVERLVGAMAPEPLRTSCGFSGYVMQAEEHEQVLYRVCQEAIANVVRHASATTIHVSATVRDHGVIVRVADDGCGILADFRPGIGLSSMRARLDAAGGSLRVGANAPRGTLVEAWLPRADRAAAT
jgi:signal transduction histidine kinase